ncbi:MAG: AAA family ATPase [Oscillochloris sp.]|nr:AAA family ATPase [Oscillochloris sp.]
MIRQLQLTNFKSFRQASLEFGGLTLLVGTNAAGKSNLRDALRFLHGVGRGYSLSDIIGGRFGEGGERIWGGIRGGPREIAFDGARTFAVGVSIWLLDELQTQLDYYIEVDPGQSGPASIISEWLRLRGDHPNGYLFRVDAYKRNLPALRARTRRTAAAGMWRGAGDMPDINHQIAEPEGMTEFYAYDTVISQRPALAQLAESSNPILSPKLKAIAQQVIAELNSMRFLDLNPDAMRNPSFPGQLTLGDRGENLSSVLQAICADEARKQALVGWLQALTPMDAVDFDFPADPIGKIVTILIEASGRRTTAYSASDGTLRFLAMLAAMLGPEPAQLYVFEELENGIHPTRLHLLLQLIEQQTAHHATQVLATTHSPQLLRLIAPQTLEATSIVYRLPGHPDSEIRRLLDIPNAQQTLQREDLAQLHDSGWLEDAVAFAADEDA